jgi:ABC-type multidrug transport system, ATPase and permease components
MEHLIWVIKRLRNYYPYILLALFGVLLESVSTAGISLMVKKLVDEGMLLRSWEGLTFGTLLLLGLALAQQLGNFLVSYYTNAYAEKEAKELRGQVFEKLLKSSFLSVRGYSLGEYTTRVLSDLKLYRDLIGSSVVKLVRDPATVLFALWCALIQGLEADPYLACTFAHHSPLGGVFWKEKGKAP